MCLKADDSRVELARLMCLKADDSRAELAEFFGWVLSVDNGTVQGI
jgi:hypothetical protein